MQQGQTQGQTVIDHPVVSPVKDKPMETKAPAPSTARVFSFEDAIVMIKNGNKITRKEWGSEKFTVLLSTIEGNKFICITNEDGVISPMLLRDVDIMADDWYVVN